MLKRFWWAEFRKNKGGIKLHTQYDVKSSIPSFIYVSEANVYNINIIELIPYETESYYAVDKEYVGFKR